MRTKASSAALLFFGGEAAIRICFHGVTQASGELFLDSYLPLLHFASVLQAASIGRFHNFRLFLALPAGTFVTELTDTTDHSLYKHVPTLATAAASSKPSHSIALF